MNLEQIMLKNVYFLEKAEKIADPTSVGLQRLGNELLLPSPVTATFLSTFAALTCVLLKKSKVPIANVLLLRLFHFKLGSFC